MTKIAISPNVSGTGTFTLTAPDSNTDRTLTLPDAGGEVLTDNSNIEAQVKTATNATGSAPIYACRAWVNFNGTGTVAIRASGNVSSITDNGTGQYLVNFAVNMPDINYAVIMGGNGGLDTFSPTGSGRQFTSVRSREPAKVDVQYIDDGGGLTDPSYASVTIFR